MFSRLLAWTPVNLVPPSPFFCPPKRSKPTNLTYPLRPPKKCKPRNLSFPLRPPQKCNPVACYSPPLPIPNGNHIQSQLTGSTRTITTLVALALSLSKHFASEISLLVLKFRPALPNPNPLEAKLLFFAAIRYSSDLRSKGTPMTVIAAGLSRWVEIYSCVLLIRVLLSWFPNIPWDNQPMSAIRDLCDPYLSLFRGIIPPLFNSLDVSPIIAFLLLGMLGQLARSPGFG